MTEAIAYTPDADALDALASRIVAAELDKPLLLLSLAGSFDVRAKAAEQHDLQAAIRIERLGAGIRARAAAKPFRPYAPCERADLAAQLRHQAVFVRRAEAALGKARPASAPVLDLTGALARRREAEDAARREKTARLIDRMTGWPRGDIDPDGGAAA